MDQIEAVILAGREAWRGIELSALGKNSIVALVTGLVLYAIVYAIERLYGTRTDNYRSRSFMHDAAYWFYYRSGLNYILLIAVVYPPLDGPRGFLDLELLVPLPIAAQAVVFFIVADFYSYWAHRAMHHFKFLWPFHTTHHAPERITFASSARFHPVEVLVQYSGIYVLIRICGSNPLVWLPMLLFMEAMLEAQHTQIPWKLGPLYRILVTPSFHWFHHSTDPACHDRNYGVVLSVWDHWFGTAVRGTEPAPVQLGLRDVRYPSLWRSLAMPFQLLYRSYAARQRTKATGAP